jgi:AAA domain
MPGLPHTMQGKEADTAILVLGGDPDRSGARGFATREPSLLNVAVTRAKRRLYVIGNRDTWGNEPYFNALAARIPAGYPAPDIGVTRRSRIPRGGHRSAPWPRGSGSSAQSSPRERR